MMRSDFQNILSRKVTLTLREILFYSTLYTALLCYFSEDLLPLIQLLTQLLLKLTASISMPLWRLKLMKLRGDDISCQNKRYTFLRSKNCILTKPRATMGEPIHVVDLACRIPLPAGAGAIKNQSPVVSRGHRGDSQSFFPRADRRGLTGFKTREMTF